MSSFQDLSGQKFGRWTVVRCASKRGKGANGRGVATTFFCVCDCGSTSTIQAGALKGGKSKSCGCLAREKASGRATKHGMTGSVEYRIWQGIKDRVFDSTCKDYENYGGRGISMFEGWVNDFEAFFTHIGVRPSKDYSIERSDNDVGYVPGNIKWATRHEQANNNRGNVRVTIDGETKTMAQWCLIFNRSYPTVAQRITQSGWEPLLALTTPTPRPFRGTNQKNGHQAIPSNDLKVGLA